MVHGMDSSKLEPATHSRASLRIHIHDDSRLLDGITSLVEQARGSHRFHDTLRAMCKHVSAIARADVVSVYLREQLPDREVLVLRGGIGLPTHAVGSVHDLFDGLTGIVVTRRRPVTVATDDEPLPAYLGVPLFAGSEVCGVLVLQRRHPIAFADVDVALALSLTAPFIFVIERAGRVPVGADDN